MSDRDLWYLFHDELADIYEPVYLHQFVAHAAQYGLQYLSDANLYNLQPATLTPEAQETIDQIAGDDRVLREQYIDFIQCRRFHHTLLCRQGCKVVFPPAPQRLEELYISTAAMSVSRKPDLTEGVKEEFKGPLDSAMNTRHPVAKALLVALIKESPQAIAFDDVLARVGGELVRDEAAQILLATSLAGLTNLHTAPLPLTNRVAKRPVASPLARYQAKRGRALTTLTHSTVEGEGKFEIKLLPLLDGKHDAAALARKLRVTQRAVDQSLRKLARLGFLC
jgi:methyltransferase-like protein